MGSWKMCDTLPAAKDESQPDRLSKTDFNSTMDIERSTSWTKFKYFINLATVILPENFWRGQLNATATPTKNNAECTTLDEVRQNQLLKKLQIDHQLIWIYLCDLEAEASRQVCFMWKSLGFSFSFVFSLLFIPPFFSVRGFVVWRLCLSWCVYATAKQSIMSLAADQDTRHTSKFKTHILISNPIPFQFPFPKKKRHRTIFSFVKR